MRVRVVAFASASDALGTSELELALPDGARVAELRERLEGDHPGLAPLWGRLAVAVDGELAPPETPLSEGCEVALLPPVSGGSGARARSGLVDGPIDVESIIRTVSDPASGAVLTFLGTVRDHHRNRPVTKLTYSAYRPMAEARLRTIVEDLEASTEGLRAALVHRLGEVPVGEPSVVIAVASPHRAAAYEASRTALERLKSEVPIWKREHYSDGGASWREEEPLESSSPSAAASSAPPRST